MKVEAVMERNVRTVDPEMALADLERAFLDARVTGFPVVSGGRLVGIVSRSDVVRQLGVEQSVAERLSDYYRESSGVAVDSDASIDEIGRSVGARLEHLVVRDVMTRATITATPEQSLTDVARTLVEHRIHRLPVVEGERLVGIVTSLDLVRLFAEGRAKPA